MGAGISRRRPASVATVWTGGFHSPARTPVVRGWLRWPTAAVLITWLAVAAVAAASELNPAEENGRQIFHQGTSGRGKEITATLQGTEIEIPAAALPCANCHGGDGKGRPEGGTFPTDLRWASLTRPYEVEHASGRRHPPYDERSVTRAITMGRDAGGNELQVAMPRYRLSQGDMGDLLAYLKRLGNEPEPGVDDSTITLGSLLLDDGPDGPNTAARAMLHAFFANLGERGGIYGRKVEVSFPTSTTSPTSSLRSLVEEQKIFALVGGSMFGVEDQLASLLDQIEVPWLAPLTYDPPVTRLPTPIFSTSTRVSKIKLGPWLSPLPAASVSRVPPPPWCAAPIYFPAGSRRRYSSKSRPTAGAHQSPGICNRARTQQRWPRVWPRAVLTPSSSCSPASPPAA